MPEFTILKNPQLDGASFSWPGGPTGVLCIHGFTATTAEVRPFAKFLNERGFTTAGPLLPGHGTTPEDLNRCKWLDWVTAAREMLLTLRSTCRQVFVAGESMGALVSLYLASEIPEISGLLLFAPALKIPNIQYSQFLAPFIPYMRSKGALKDDGLPWQGYNVRPLRAAYQLSLFQLEIRKRLPMIHQPALIVQGRLDQTIDPLSSTLVYEKLGSQDKTIVWLENSGHVLLLDKEKETAFDTAQKFILRVAKPDSVYP